MAMAESLPPDASTASTGLGLRYIGDKHCYAYSGEVIVANATVTCLDFISGAGYIMANFTQSLDAGALGQGQVIGFTIELNGVAVCVFEERVRSFSGEESIGLQTYKFLIPPLTLVTTKGYTDDGSNNPFFHTITGRVYGVA